MTGPQRSGRGRARWPGSSQEGSTAEQPRGLSRRALLRDAGALALVTASLGGCSWLSNEPAGRPGGGGGGGAKGKEAPMLAERVKAGSLPPVEQRLPKTPFVVQPHERMGVYGGTWRSAVLGPADAGWLTRTMGYENLLRWDPAWDKPVPGPNVADIEASDDLRVFTIKLREGMRWSDGQPFTVKDVLFAYNDVIRNAEINPVVTDFVTSGGTAAEMEQVDDHTVRMTFAKPNSLFLAKLAMPSRGNLFCAYPQHYLKTFHKAFNPDADNVAKSQGFPTWPKLFTAKAMFWENPELPTVWPWLLKTPISKATRVEFERNPYYWKTDPEGSQLPYLDRVVFDVVEDTEVILLKAQKGELDMHARHINTLPNKPVLAGKRESGKYRFIDLKNCNHNEMAIAFNLNHKDPVLRDIFGRKDFRVGLSHAIDRDELINAVFQRQGKPWQAAPIEGSGYHDEEFGTQYLRHDPDEANRALDRAGLTAMNAAGVRLRPDGQPLRFAVEVATPSLSPFWVDAMQLIVAHWKRVGIEAEVRNEDRSLWFERLRANNMDANVWLGDGGYKDAILNPIWYLPSTGNTFAVEWAEWFTSRGKKGKEPPAVQKEQIELYWELETAPSLERRDDLFRQILTIAKEQFYAIGTVYIDKTYGIVAERMKNVPALIPESPNFNTPGPTNPEQYFFAE
jgi:peptide/nickel transport system substrate-binding protein